MLSKRDNDRAYNKYRDVRCAIAFPGIVSGKNVKMENTWFVDIKLQRGEPF